MKEFRKTYHSKGVHLYVAELQKDDQMNFSMSHFRITEIQESPFCTALFSGKVKTMNEGHIGIEWDADPSKRFGNSMVFPGDYSVLAREPSVWLCMSPIPLPSVLANPPKIDYILLDVGEPLAEGGILAYGRLEDTKKVYEPGSEVPTGAKALLKSVVYTVKNASID